MAGGPAFLREETELTTRFCYVNFDGAEALRQSEARGLDTELDDEFVKEYCALVHEGVMVRTHIFKEG